MDPFGNFGWDFGFGFGWILIIITLVLLALGIAALVRMGSSGGEAEEKAEEKEICPPNESPLDVLNKRYARGEITKEEFERKRADIGSGSEQKRAA